MYGKEYWQRTGVNHIFELIRTGGVLLKDDTKNKTAEDRHNDYTASAPLRKYADHLTASFPLCVVSVHLACLWARGGSAS